MKKIILAALAALIVLSLALIVIMGRPSTHRVYGKWEWTRAKNNCTEVYDFRPDNTSIVTSGEEVAESRFTIARKPDMYGFYQMTDEVTKSNGRTGCDDTPGGTPVGDVATIYIYFHQTKDEMVMCSEPSLRTCFGPLRRVLQ